MISNRPIFQILLAALVAIATAMPASALEIRPLHWSDLDRMLGQGMSYAKREFGNKTIRVEVTSRARGDSLKRILNTGSFIAYAKSNGDLVWWNGKYKVALPGRWKVREIIPGVLDPCFQLATQSGLSDCFRGGTANFREITDGNPFGLTAGEAPQFRMSRKITLAKMAKQKGL